MIVTIGSKVRCKLYNSYSNEFIGGFFTGTITYIDNEIIRDYNSPEVEYKTGKKFYIIERENDDPIAVYTNEIIEVLE